MLAAKNYADARERITAMIGYLYKLASIGESGDPSGSGGAGPVH